MATRRMQLRERFDPDPRQRVDESAGVIYRVRVLGPRSRNGRHYPLDTIKAAVPLYEGVVVRKDHPDDPDAQRCADDTLGWLRNVRVEGNSLFADLHYLKSHPFNRTLVEAARRNPRAFGLSHNADGRVDGEGDRVVVKAITEVRSVDVVDGPATTTGLFEATQRRKRHMAGKNITLREWFDRTKLLAPVRRRLKKLLEAGGYDPEMDMAPVMEADPPMDVEGAPARAGLDPADMDPEEALRGGLRAAFAAVFDDTTLDAKAKLARAKQLVLAAEELLGKGEEIPEAEIEADPDEPLVQPVAESDDNDADDDELLECDDDAPPEKVRESLRRHKARQRARSLCREAGVEPTRALLEAMVSLPSDSRRQELLEEVRPRYRAQTADERGNLERPGRTRRDEGEVRTSEDFARRLLGGGNN